MKKEHRLPTSEKSLQTPRMTPETTSDQVEFLWSIGAIIIHGNEMSRKFSQKTLACYYRSFRSRYTIFIINCIISRLHYSVSDTHCMASRSLYGASVTHFVITVAKNTTCQHKIWLYLSRVWNNLSQGWWKIYSGMTHPGLQCAKIDQVQRKVESKCGICISKCDILILVSRIVSPVCWNLSQVCCYLCQGWSQLSTEAERSEVNSWVRCTDFKE